MGLACLALDLPLSADEAANGLVAVAAAQYVIGKVTVPTVPNVPCCVQLADFPHLPDILYLLSIDVSQL